ncbi:hypothetical protein SteCoe_16960 [Stentor coeruleus]|uniref:Uncharacterized protein n=1 Tax=Stentor coeruleus TaxID=5963 RepID=A0A1R2C040_9CILI|nr:hypothetical protein SteCoe_16960 [Stentor coeruleus]
MFIRGLYRCLYTPASKLEFKKGKCLLLKDQQIDRAVSINIISMFTAPILVFWGLKYKVYSTLSILFWPAFPFFIYNILLSTFIKNTVNGILLHNDGKTLTFRLCFDTEFKTFKIEELKFSDIQPEFRALIAFKKVVTLPNKEIMFIPKVAKIFHQDVFEKIMEGEEIYIQEKDQENQEDQEDQNESSDETDSEKKQ